MKFKLSYGFSLIELLLVMAIIGILSTTLFIAVNPARQFAVARDTQRETDLFGILSSIYQYTSEHGGDLPDTDPDPLVSDFPTVSTCIGTDSGCFNLGGAGETGETIVPVYLPVVPKDPKLVSSGQAGTDGNTGYEIYVDANGRLIATAQGEVKGVITITR